MLVILKSFEGYLLKKLSKIRFLGRKMIKKVIKITIKDQIQDFDIKN